MNNNENLKNEEMETKEEVKEMTVQENYSISDFGGIGRNSTTKTQVFTNITDRKKLISFLFFLRKRMTQILMLFLQERKPPLMKEKF